MPTNISVTSANLPHPIQFNLFDNVRVSLKLRKSHAHRHMVYMTLVDLEHVEIKGKKDTPPVRMTNTEMIQAIEAEEEKNSTINIKQLSSKKKKKNPSVYEVLEKFRKLSIVENKAAV
jgi:DIS3-like exonuclease 1